MAQSSEMLDGFWLPASLRPLIQEADWEVHHVLAGRPVPPGEGVAVRWPILPPLLWERLLTELRAASEPAMPDLLMRWQRALEAVPRILVQQPDMLTAVARYTGYPTSMLALAFTQGELMGMDDLACALEHAPNWTAARTWQPMTGGLPGALRFFSARPLDGWTAPLRGKAPLFHPLPPADLALGFAAGNVPGNGLLVALLSHIANHTRLDSTPERPPAVLVRNSRQAPLFAPWVLAAVEQVDAELVANVAMLIWDYEDAALQRSLLGQADLVMAAASDPTIASIDAHLEQIGRPVRFHRHGHKVSFAVIGRFALQEDLSLLTRSAALDSTFWDQYGCLSARVHFVERGGRHSPADYAQALSREMRELVHRLPRGAAPLRFLHRAYDVYQLLAGEGDVQVFTGYDDGCLVVLDERGWNRVQWRDTINRCTGRVVVVRPVEDTAYAFTHYIGQIPPTNLQSVSLAVKADRVMEVAEEAGRRGVTALRSLGRAAFPRISYSWDGELPLDLGNRRPPGHFTTVETKDPLADLQATAHSLALE